MEVVALLCDHAQVEGGKLFVSGAAINRINSAPVDPPYRVNVAIAVMVTIPWTATNQAHAHDRAGVRDGRGERPDTARAGRAAKR